MFGSRKRMLFNRAKQKILHAGLKLKYENL